MLDTVDTIRQSFRELAGNADVLVDRFLEELLKEGGRFERAFENSDTIDFRQRFARGLSAIVRYADDEPALRTLCRQLGARHVEYGIAADDFHVVPIILLRVFEEQDCWNPEFRSAWETLLGAVVRQMQDGANRSSPKEKDQVIQENSAEAIAGVGNSVTADFVSRAGLSQLAQPKPSTSAQRGTASRTKEKKTMVTTATATKDNGPETNVATETGTDLLQLQAELGLKNSMLENMPINVILADTDLIITYVNPASVKQLRSLEQYLPIKVDEIVGQNIDIFHKDPAHQRGILSNPDNLPRRAQIAVGPETLDLLVSARVQGEQVRLLGNRRDHLDDFADFVAGVRSKRPALETPARDTPSSPTR